MLPTREEIVTDSLQTTSYVDHLQRKPSEAAQLKEIGAQHTEGNRNVLIFLTSVRNTSDSRMSKGHERRIDLDDIGCLRIWPGGTQGQWIRCLQTIVLVNLPGCESGTTP